MTNKTEMTNKEIIANNYIEAKLTWDHVTSDTNMGLVTDWDAFDAEMDVAYLAYHTAQVALLEAGKEYLFKSGISDKLLKTADPETKAKVYDLLLSAMYI